MKNPSEMRIPSGAIRHSRANLMLQRVDVLLELGQELHGLAIAARHPEIDRHDLGCSFENVELDNF